MSIKYFRKFIHPVILFRYICYCIKLRRTSIMGNRYSLYSHLIFNIFLSGHINFIDFNNNYKKYVLKLNI